MSFTPAAGALKPIFLLISPIVYFIIKTLTRIQFKVHIWKLSLQLSCGDTFQVCVLYSKPDKYDPDAMDRIKRRTIHNGATTLQSYDKPHPSIRGMPSVDITNHASSA